MNQVDAQIKNAAAGRHYCRPGAPGEFLDAMRLLFSEDEVRAFLRISAMSYLSRFDLKWEDDPAGQLTDLAKTDKFVDFLRQQIDQR